MIEWKTMVRPAVRLAVCTSAVLSLQACVEVVVGTAMVSAPLIATDRRTLGAQTEDKEIMVKGESRASTVAGDSGHVNVTSFNRKVLLTGEVKDEATKAAVEQQVGTIEGVKSIVNELEIGGASSFASRSNDALITGKVKASFVDSKELQANNYKVVTERGAVYLMGRVIPREGKLAAQVASGVGGVTKVVTAYEYITEEELKQFTSK